MSMDNFRALKEKRDELVLVAQDLAVIGAPYGTEIPEQVVDGDGNLLAMPEGWTSFGEVAKDAGVEIAPDRKFNDIYGYGSMASRRRIKESEAVTLNVTPQETRFMLQQMQYSLNAADFKTLDGDAGYKARKFAQGGDQYWSILLVGFDGTADKPIYPWWLFDKMSIGEGGKQSLKTDSPLAPELSFSAYEAQDGGMYSFGIGGKGWVDLSKAAGFAGAASAPVTVTIKGTGGTFILKFGSAETEPLPHNATAAAIRAALEKLDTIGAGNVNVSGSTGKFTVAIDSSKVGNLTADGGNLTGTGAGAEVTG